jgi:YjjG family noncanonical pyrimidine nucleotidase
MKNIKHIFFDLDHTLWDFDKNSEMAFAEIFKNQFPKIEISSFIKVYVPINQECWRLYQADQITHQELRYQRLKQSFNAINVEISDEEIDFVAQKYLELLPQNNFLFEGCLEVLDYLKPKYNLHIITNGFAEVQEKKIKNAGLHHYFQSITNSETADAKKPSPKIFEQSLKVASAEKQNSIMIGDSWEADILGAVNFGISAIYFTENLQQQDENILQINSLLALKNHF